MVRRLLPFAFLVMIGAGWSCAPGSRPSDSAAEGHRYFRVPIPSGPMMAPGSP
jgi:hypothetical protein